MYLRIVALILGVGMCVADAQTVYYNLSYGANSYQTLDGYVAAQPGSRIVVMVHGGWWIGGDKWWNNYPGVALQLQSAGFAVANINYRLAPGVTFPAQPSDLACAIAFVKQNAQLLNGDSSRVALWGHSAGGHLVALHGVNPSASYLQLQDCPSAALNVDKVVGVAGVYDFDLAPPDTLPDPLPFIHAMIGDSADSVQYWQAAQPIEYDTGTARAEFLVMAGDADQYVDWRQSQVFHDSLAGHGTTVAFALFPGRDHWSIYDTSPTGPTATTVIPFLKDTITANLKAFLQGPFTTPGDSMRTSLLQQEYLPLERQPYNVAPWNYSGTESVASIPSGVVDWVLVELRTGTDAASVVATRAGFIKGDGSIVDLDGMSPVVFTNLAAGNYYVVVRHRNHLAIMSASAVALSSSSRLYDFTGSQNAAYSSDYGLYPPMKDLGNEKFGMYAGDGNGDGGVYAEDYTLYQTHQGNEGYDVADYNLDGGVYAEDYTLRRINQGKETQVR